AAWAAWPASPIVNVPIGIAPDGVDPPVALSDGAGGAFIAWPDFRPGPNPHIYSSNIYAQHVLASGDVDPAWPVNGEPFFVAAASQLNPAIESDGSGGILVAWLDHRDGLSDAYVHHMLGSGTVAPGWPVRGRALTNLHGAIDLDIASDGAGGAFVIWDVARVWTDMDIYG